MRLTLSLNFSALLLLLLFLLLLLLDLSPFSESGGGGGEVDYGDALKKSIMFFEGQRSGFLPADQRINWRGNSGLGDGSELNVDLVGGYYDAGDNIKFGFPMAFTATMLAWSVVEFGSIMPAAELRQALVAIRWETDYLLKTVADPNRIYVQVGEPGSDHNCWERPEDMDTLRTVYFVEAPQPASDIAGETAAALAASSMAFRSFDPSYSYKLLGKAVEVFEYADKYRGAYSDNANVKSGACPFYCDFSGYQDELLWGAAWLKRATQNDSYFTYIKVNGKTLGAEDTSNEFGWDNKRAGTNVVIAKEVLDGTASAEALQSYKLMADGFICSLIPESPSSHIEYTPGGLIYKTGGSNLQHVTSISFLLLVYADYLSKSPSPVDCGGGVTITPAGLRGRAKRQADYVLGKNPNGMSYMVGFGYRYPQRPHHRGSSLPSIHDHPARIGCAEGALYFNQTDPNPNQLTGALVGGPGEGDEFADERRDYKKLEPTTYMNAPFVGVLAVLAAYPNIAY